MTIGFRKPLAEMTNDELIAELAAMRAGRKAKAIARREAHKKRQSEPSEIDILLRSLPKEAKEELAALVVQFQEKEEKEP